METKLNVKLLTHTLEPELVVALAGKLCYSPSNIDKLQKKQTKEDIERFVSMLVSMGHESPLEHASFTFAIEGVSRSLTHQLVRHRIASYSQQSQRYVKEKQFEYIVPKDIKRNAEIYEEYKEYMLETQKMYDLITDFLLFDYLTLKEEKENLKKICIKSGVDFCEFNTTLNTYIRAWAEVVTKSERSIDDIIRELVWLEDKREVLRSISELYPKVMSVLIKRAIENARYILPNATETKIICTMNLRSLINFCSHRICKRAQDEIRELALGMRNEVEKVSPLFAQCLGAGCEISTCKEGKMSCGSPYPRRK